MYCDLMDSSAYTLLHSFIAFLVLLSWLCNLAFWLQFLINSLTYLLTGKLFQTGGPAALKHLSPNQLWR